MFICAFQRTSTQVKNCAIGKHFSNCEQAQYLANLQNQFSLLNDIPLPSSNVPYPIEYLVFNNLLILHLTKSTNYNILAFLEALLNSTIHNLTHDLRLAKNCSFLHSAPSTLTLSSCLVSACLFVNIKVIPSCRYSSTILVNLSFPLTLYFRSLALYICCM